MLYANLAEALRTNLIDQLEARLILCEFRRVGLNSVIDSPFVAPEDRNQAILERGAVLIEWGEVMTQLHELKEM